MFYGPIIFEVNVYLFLDYLLLESEEDSAKDESAEVGESKVVKLESRLFFEIQKPLPQSSEAWSNILRTSPIGILSFSLEERLRRQPQPLFEIQHI